MPSIIESIELDVFADEIRPFSNKRKEQWAYIGILLVPTHKKDLLLKNLHDARLGCGYHGEIKSNKLAKVGRRELAKEWIKIVLGDGASKSMYFSILGLNLSNLDGSRFGTKDFDNAYNRFFRSTLKGAINACFPSPHISGKTTTYRSVVVRSIYHDCGMQEGHELFPWHSIRKIEQEQERIKFNCSEITFLDSDHRKPKGSENSHIIQLTDLIMGLTCDILDHRSTDKTRRALALNLLPLVERMMTKPGHLKSSYGYAYKYLLSFFPRKRFDRRSPFEPFPDSYYSQRPLLLQLDEAGQDSLFGQW